VVTFDRHVAGEALRHRGLGGKRPERGVGFESGVGDAGAVVDEATGGFDLYCHVGEHELQPPEFDDRLAELPPLLGVGHGRVEGALRETHRDGPDGRTVHVENPHRDPEAVAFLADAILDRYPHIFQMDRGVRNPVQAKLAQRFVAISFQG
jgi:hypothetical protein